ncbi:replication protein A 70 kDa DNA-binding subunit A-like isoform X2 [Miscanthus floridulus]|uniref:replication protein A 70 kDa DNA-binding subunit A-like isoform X2 n=1 Tax=Miscanthus floridulus TaxID=154761 RepID=UPI003457A1ED
MGGGGGEVMEVPLSTGALEAMWREDGLRPVLQLADAPQMAGGGPASEAGRYRVALCDGGARLHPGMLAASLNHLVARGALRRGTVIRVLEYLTGFSRTQRVIIVIQLEILHAECMLIRSPTIFEANASQHIGVSCSGGLAIHEPCFMPCTQQSTVEAKMQQLSLNDHQNQRFMKTATGLSGTMAAWLTPGAVVAVSEHGDGNGTLQPVLQVVDVRMVKNVENPSAECFRMVLSDGVYTMQSMLATAKNTRVRDGSIQKGSIIHLQEFTCSTIQNRRFIIVSKLYVLQSECNIMGNPKPYEMRNQPNEQVTNLLANAAQANTGITPVSALNPYQTIWKIKARVTAKTDLRHYNSSRGPGNVFSFDLLDGQGGEIRATCFNAQADQFFDLIEVDKVYLISKGSVKPAQKKFNSLNHEYEITLDFKTSIEVCIDDDSNIPRQQYNFRQISEIENIEAGAIVDLVGIVTSVGPSAMIIRKDGSEAQKRTLQLKDMSVRSMEIILWGKFCDAEGHQLQLLCDSDSNPILSLKGGRVSDFSGRSVVTISSTQLKVNPDFPVAERLKQWYITEGKNTACISLSRGISNMSGNHVLKTIAQIKDENLGRSDKPDFITVRAVLSHVGADKFCYQACSLELNGKQCCSLDLNGKRCYKKVMRNGDGTWYCDKCNQRTENCEYRYMLSCQIKDHTGTTYVTAFQEAGEAIFGHTAQELFMIRNVEQDDLRFTEIMQAVLRREYLFKLKIDEQTYKREQRVKCTIIGVKKLEETNNLLKDVSRPVLKDDSSYTPNVGSANLEARQSMLTSSNANLQLDRASYSSSMLASSNVGATGFAQSNWMPTPPSASSDGCDFNGGFGFLDQSAVRGAPLCFKCNQPGHWFKDCLV